MLIPPQKSILCHETRVGVIKRNQIDGHAQTHAQTMRVQLHNLDISRLNQEFLPV